MITQKQITKANQRGPGLFITFSDPERKRQNPVVKAAFTPKHSIINIPQKVIVSKFHPANTPKNVGTPSHYISIKKHPGTISSQFKEDFTAAVEAPPKHRKAASMTTSPCFSPSIEKLPMLSEKSNVPLEQDGREKSTFFHTRPRKYSFSDNLQGHVANDKDALLKKYVTERKIPETASEVGKTFTEFFTDLEVLLPGHEKVLEYMKGLATTLHKDKSSLLRNSNTTTGVGSGDNTPKRLVKATHNKGVKLLINMHNRAGSMSNLSSLVPQQPSVRNVVVRHKQTGSLDMRKPPVVPKLDLKMTRVGSQDYMDEFMSKVDEFSESWRLEAEAMMNGRTEGDKTNLKECI